MPIKVCVLTSAHPVFDVRIFHKECKTLVRAGYDVTLVAGHSESLSVDGVTIKAVRPAKGRFERWSRTTAAVYRAAVAVDANIYHFHDPELIPVGLLLRARGKKVIYDMHEDLPRTVPYKPYVPKWLQPALAKVLAIGESLAVPWFSGLIAASPAISARYAHPNLSIVDNYPRREEFPEDSKTPTRGDYVVYVGMRITRARGAVEMMRAIELVPQALRLRLKLVGTIEPGDLVDELKAMPGWGSTEYVGPLGRAGVSELTRNAMAGLVVLHPEPNYVNSHPVKLFEYMCSGIPVIASDFPVFRRIIEQAQCGLLVDSLSPKKIAEAIEFLASHPEEAQAMGARGRQAVNNRYNWQHEEQTLLRMYDRLCHDAAGACEHLGSELP